MSDVTAIEQGEITAQMRSAEDALVQLRKKHYADAFASDGRPVHYVGVNYNPAADVRTIDDVKCERADA